MKKIQLYFIFFLWSFQTLQAQMYFNNRYDVYGSWDMANSIIATDSCYFVLGNAYDSSGKFRVIFYQISLNGTIQNEKNIETSGWSTISGNSSSMQAVESGFVFSGGLFNTAGSNLATLVHLNFDGDTLWFKVFGDTIHYYNGFQCKQTPDRGFIIAGGMNDGSSTQALLIKTDSLGNKLWERYYGGSGIEYGFSVCLTSDGGYLIAGQTTSGSVGGSNQYLVKTDSLGNAQWTKSYGTNYYEYARNIIKTSDGNYVYCGFQGSSTTDYTWPSLTKIDTAGNIIWDKKYGPLRYSAILYDLKEDFDAEIISVGMAAVSGLKLDGLVIRASNSTGNQVFYRRAIHLSGLNSVNRLYGLDIASNNEIIACGTVAPMLPDTGSQDIWVIKLDEWGCDTAGCQFVGIEEEYESKDVALRVYPNPNNGIFTLEFTSDTPFNGGSIEVVDISGRLVFSGLIHPNQRQVEIHLETLYEGIYFYRFTSESGLYFSGKFVIRR